MFGEAEETRRKFRLRMLEHALAIDFAAVVMQKHARRRLSRTAVANAMVNAMDTRRGGQRGGGGGALTNCCDQVSQHIVRWLDHR